METEGDWTHTLKSSVRHANPSPEMYMLLKSVT